jgi:predicted extracellular nuclease
MRRFFLLLPLLLGISASLFAQKQSYKVAVIGFYNLENLFDTINDPGVDDEEFSPDGPRRYSAEIYLDKLTKLATVLSQMGTEINVDGPGILGVAEVENAGVLEDLVKHPLIAKRGYKVIHYNSRDARGIDVGLLYNPKYFSPEQSDKLFVSLPSGSKDAYYTRDVLWVKGKLDGEDIHVYVNHWPSRSGGEKRSEPGRLAAARVCRTHMDSIRKIEKNPKVIVMGDLNDDPINKSITEVIGAQASKEDVLKGGMYNPWTELYKKGYGTLAYQDAWGLFDQILVSHPWLTENQKGFFFKTARIFNKEYMVENKGRYKGYPMRTWDGLTYRGGYSDHFPTYLILLKETEPVKKAF